MITGNMALGDRPML